MNKRLLPERAAAVFQAAERVGAGETLRKPKAPRPAAWLFCGRFERTEPSAPEKRLYR